ncbi:hypothetical protein Nepgr_030873 [Nepenthes gracilis]|uniref:Uncharacterized protein n=1 Tax=Nepenthes gracilis TaxID=150966 RepID=A0AAD3TFE1_NEPGR|nr:hypothetical protein Nepgr_030873 [Nepenthes gracilis]
MMPALVAYCRESSYSHPLPPEADSSKTTSSKVFHQSHQSQTPSHQESDNPKGKHQQPKALGQISRMRSATSNSSRPELAARPSEGEPRHFKTALYGEEIMAIAPRTISTRSQTDIAHRP